MKKLILCDISKNDKINQDDLDESTKKMIDYIYQYIPKDGICIDIGANIGFMSMHMAQKCIDGKIYAIEPDKNNSNRLRKNIVANSLNNIIILEYALGSQEKNVSLYINKKNYGDTRLSKDKNLTKTKYVVIMNTLDNIFTNEEINFVKIDTQGYEYDIFLGGYNFIQRNISCVYIIEYWPYGIMMSGRDVNEFSSFLSNTFSSIVCLENNEKIHKKMLKRITSKLLKSRKEINIILKV